MSVPQEFFTLQSMLTLSGAAGATFVICNGLQRAFNFNPRWLGLLLAQLLAFFGVHQSGGSGSDYFIGFINGFLIFSVAVGATTMAGGSAPSMIARGAPNADLPHRALGRRGFFSPWF